MRLSKIALRCKKIADSLLFKNCKGKTAKSVEKKLLESCERREKKIMENFFVNENALINHKHVIFVSEAELELLFVFSFHSSSEK